jgi:hypothetical protein
MQQHFRKHVDEELNHFVSLAMFTRVPEALTQIERTIVCDFVAGARQAAGAGPQEATAAGSKKYPHLLAMLR